MAVQAGARKLARVEGDEVHFRFQFHLELVAFPPASETLVLEPENKTNFNKISGLILLELQGFQILSLPIQICSFQVFNLIDKLRICYNGPRQPEILDENYSNSGQCCLQMKKETE